MFVIILENYNVEQLASNTYEVFILNIKKIERVLSGYKQLYELVIKQKQDNCYLKNIMNKKIKFYNNFMWQFILQNKLGMKQMDLKGVGKKKFLRRSQNKEIYFTFQREKSPKVCEKEPNNFTTPPNPSIPQKSSGFQPEKYFLIQVKRFIG